MKIKNKFFISFGYVSIICYIFLLQCVCVSILLSIKLYWWIIFLGLLFTYFVYAIGPSTLINSISFKHNKITVHPSYTFYMQMQHKIVVDCKNIVIVEVTKTYGINSMGEKIAGFQYGLPALYFYLNNNTKEMATMAGFSNKQVKKILKELLNRNPEILIDDKINILKK